MGGVETVNPFTPLYIFLNDARGEFPQGGFPRAF